MEFCCAELILLKHGGLTSLRKCHGAARSRSVRIACCHDRLLMTRQFDVWSKYLIRTPEYKKRKSVEKNNRLQYPPDIV